MNNNKLKQSYRMPNRNTIFDYYKLFIWTFTDHSP